MDKLKRNLITGREETVRYGKRYGYWWKKHREVARKITNYSPAVDYFYDLEFTLDKPMSHKHFKRWLR